MVKIGLIEARLSLADLADLFTRGDAADRVPATQVCVCGEWECSRPALA